MTTLLSVSSMEMARERIDWPDLDDEGKENKPEKGEIHRAFAQSIRNDAYTYV